MSFSNALENWVLNLIFGKEGYHVPSVAVGLSLTHPGEDGSLLNEPSGNGYDRVYTSPAHWGVASLGQLTNAAEFIFPTATGNWGTVTHFVVFDSGSMLLYGALSAPWAITLGCQPRFAAGDLLVTLD